MKTNRLLLFILTLVTIISSESFSFIPNFRILRVLIWIMFAIYLLFFYENQHYQDKRLQKQLLYCIGVIYLIYYIIPSVSEKSIRFWFVFLKFIGT